MSDCAYPCPCGYHGDAQKPRACASAIVTKYQKRISGPILGRVDIHIEAPRVDYEKLSGDRLGETSEAIRKRVQAARDIQHARFANPNSQFTDVICNADMRIGEARQFCSLQPEGQSLMRAAMSQLNLSARAYRGQRLNPAGPHCRGVAVPSEVDDGVIFYGYKFNIRA